MRFIFIILISLFCSCNREISDRQKEVTGWMEENGKKKILCTTEFISCLVEQVGGQYVDSLALIWGEHNPHSYQLVKGDGEKFERADLIFFNGLGLENSSSLAFKLQNSPSARSLGQHLMHNMQDKILSKNGIADPHIWMDIELFSSTVAYITEEVGKLVPEHKDQIKNNGDLLVQKMHTVHEKIKKLLHSVPKDERYLVTTHDAFHYFARAYMTEKKEFESGDWIWRCQAPEGFSPEGQLSAYDIRRLVNHIIKHKIPVVFAEVFVNKDALKKLISSCRQHDQHVRLAKKQLFSDSLAPKGTRGDNYLDMMEYNAHAITEELLRGNNAPGP